MKLQVAIGALAGGALITFGLCSSFSPPRLSVAPRPSMNDALRVGINLGTRTSWGAEQLASNVIRNPGFEETIDRAIVMVSHHDGPGSEDDQGWLERPNGFWKGASYEIRSGRFAGKSGVIIGSWQTGPDGFPEFLTQGPPPDLAKGDVSAIQHSGRRSKSQFHHMAWLS